MARSPRYSTNEALGMVLGKGVEAFDSGSESEIEKDEEFPCPVNLMSTLILTMKIYSPAMKNPRTNLVTIHFTLTRSLPTLV